MLKSLPICRYIMIRYDCALVPVTIIDTLLNNTRMIIMVKHEVVVDVLRS